MTGTAPGSPGYDAGARLLHWASAAAIVAAFLLGLAMGELPRGPLRDLGREAHYSLGVLALGLAVLRLAWRAVRPMPGPLPGTPRWQHNAARLMHGALLSVALAVPAAGLLDRWARGRPVSVFGGLPLPPPFPIPGGRLWGEAHEALAWSLAALLAAHLLAVAWHVLVLHDGTFRRMLGQSCRLG